MAAKSLIKGGRVGSIKKLKASLKKGSADQYLARVPKDSSMTVRFLEEPTEWFEYYEFYDELDKQMYPVAEGGPEPTGDSKPSKRYLCNAVDTTENKVIALVLPKSLAASLNKKYEKFNTLMDRDYEIIREGEGFDTVYDAIPEAPTKMNLSKYEPFDLIEMLEKQLPNTDEDDDDEEDLDEPVAKARPNPRAAAVKKSRQPSRTGKSDDDDDDDDAPAPKKVKKPIRKPIRK